ETGGYERASEDRAGDVDEREHARDPPGLLGKKEVGPMIEALLDHPLPAGAVKERRLRALADEAIPALGLPILELPNANRSGHWSGVSFAMAGANTRSTRSHRKSRDSRSSFPSMRPRLV